MDYLSFIAIRQKTNPTYPCLDWQDYVILNSTTNVDKALYPLAEYEHIHCLLDNDDAGRKATQAIQKEYCWHVRDSSHLYSEYKDLNDYLCGKKFNQAENRIQQSTQQTQPEKQKQVVSTKLTELQYYAIKKRAGESGLPISEYARQAVVPAEVIPG